MFTLTRIFNDLCAEDQWVPLTSLLRLGSETWFLSTSCLSRNRNYKSLPPDYRASRAVPGAGKHLGLDM